MKPHRLLPIVLAVSALAACMPRHARERVAAPNARLAVGAESFQDDGPFRVTFAGPKGESPEVHEVTIAFSRPVRAAGVLDDGPAAGCARVERADDRSVVEGTWRWFGARTAVFWPNDRFANATEYRVIIDAGLRSLDRAPLGEVPAFTFTTARPNLSGVTYAYDTEQGTHAFELSFALMTSNAEVLRAVRIEGRSAKGLTTIPFRLLDTESTQGTRIRVGVGREIAGLEDVAVIASPSLGSLEGPLTGGQESRTPVPAVGPLRAELGCGDWSDDAIQPTANAAPKRCDSQRPDINLRFSKPVLASDLARHLVLSSPSPQPPPPQGSGSLQYLDLAPLMQLAPGRRYKVTLKAGLRTEDSERLTADQVLDFEMLDLPKSVAFRDLDADVIVESARPALALHLATLNVGAFDLVQAPLDEPQLLDLLLRGPRSLARVRALPGSITTTMKGGARRNVGVATHVDVRPPLRAPGVPGALVVATAAEGLADEVRVLSFTDLGVTTKWSPHGGLVWVTRLSSAAPVVNASVSLRRAMRGPEPLRSLETSETFQAKTNAEGLAILPAQATASFLADAGEPLLVVSDGADRAYVRLPAPDDSLARAIGDLFTERQLYRPGETAFVKGYFRAPSPRGLVTLAGKQANVEALDGEGHVLFAQTVTLDAFGAFSCAMALPRTARLGSASVRARVGRLPHRMEEGAARRYHADYLEWPAHARFLIDEFRTAEFKVESTTDRAAYTRGDSTRFTARGTYLFGAPMHGVPVAITATRSATTFTPSGLEGFRTDARDLEGRPPLTSELASVEATLGDDGSVTTAVPLTMKDQSGPENVELSASIADVSRAFAFGSSSTILVHPGDLYLGIRPASGIIYANTHVHAELAAASPDGTRRPGVATHLELFHASKDDVARPTGRGCDLVTTRDVVACDLAVTEPGRYWLGATALDAKGRPISAAQLVYVQGGRPPPPPPPTKPNPEPPPPPPALSFDEECRLPPRKDQYPDLITIEGGDSYRRTFAVGDKAHLCLRGHGDTLFTLEREGVLRHEVRRLSDRGTLVDVVITPELFPNVTVALHTVSGRDGAFPATSGARARSDDGHPSSGSRSIGLRVVWPEKKLTVALVTAPELRPGADAVVDVSVKDGAGRPTPAQVTLWAVDEGAVLLRPFTVPDLDRVFAEERGSDVRVTDTRDQLFWERVGMHQTKAPSLRQGMTSTGHALLIGRSAFRPTAWFLPSVITGADGRARVTARLPDNLTTWRLYAVAATTEDGFGSTESSFRTAKPLMVRPALPRFMRVGDHVEATAMVDSMSKSPMSVMVSMRAAGTLDARPHEVLLTLPPEGHLPVSFPVDANAAGKGSVTFRVEAKREKLLDEVTIDEDVSSPSTLETVVLAGETRARVDEPLGDLSRARPDVGGLALRVSASPIVGLASSLEGLIEYPYGCTEQLTSRLIPLVRLRRMAKELGVELPRDVDGAVRSALSSLLSHQRADGGFGFWPGSRTSEAWLTIAALDALVTARDAGHTVPREPIERATSYLEKAEGLDPATRALLEDHLARAGQPRDKELRALAADPTLPLFGRALVAHALARVDRALALRLLAEVASHARVTGARAVVQDEASLHARTHLSSEARTTAMVLRAQVALDPTSPLVAKLVRGLLSLRKDGRWTTTQASAWALLALDAARALFDGTATTARVSFDGKELVRVALGGTTSTAGGRVEAWSGALPMSRLAAAPFASLSFTAEGGPLFYEGALRYARRTPPEAPLEHGIHVARTLRVLRGGDREPTVTNDYRVGDYVEVDVLLASPVARELVVLDDPVPAGFEAVNQTFANTDRGAIRRDPSNQVTHRELRDERVVTFFDELPAGMHHTSYVLRVMAPGRFVVPAAKAECMYAPDVFGRTAASTITTR